ncbi:MAG: hypothetical protein KDA50_06255 [Rhodobacteraceae bacterium]|nr:hypothetical protein [Paracoccaceae bacterium]
MAPTRIRSKALTALAVAIAALALQASDAAAQTRRVIVVDGAERALTARSGETLDLLFRDGASLLLGPGGSLRIDTDERQIVLAVSGDAVLRITTGQPGRARPIRVTTADADLLLTGGAAVVAIGAEGTRAHLLIGGDLSVAQNGTTRQLYRPGFQVTAAPGRLSRPQRLDGTDIVRDLDRIAPGLGRSPISRQGDGQHAPRTKTELSASPPTQAGQSATPLVASLTRDPDAAIANDGAGADAECAGTVQTRDGGAECLLPNNLATSDTGAENAGDLLDGHSADGTVSTPVAFTDGFGSLGLAALYAGTDNTLSVVAETSSSITDGGTTDTFQGMTAPFVVSEDFFIDTISLLFTDQVNTPPNILPPGVGPRRYGPTTNTFFTTGSWDTIGAPNTLLMPSAFENNGGLSYLLGNPGVTFGSSRVLVLRRRDSQAHNNSGQYIFRGLTGGQRFIGITAQPDLGIGTLSAQGPVRDVLAFGISLGDHLPAASRAIDNFLFVEAVDAVTADFTPGPGVATSAPVLAFIGQTAPGLVFAENVISTDLNFNDTPYYRVTIPDTANPRSLLFAAGDLDGLVFSSLTGDPNAPFTHQTTYPDSAVTYDRFQIAAGVMNWFGSAGGWGPLDLPDPDAAPRNAAGRSFLRDATWTDLGSPNTPLSVADLTDRGAFLVNPAAPLVDINALYATAPGNVVPGGAQSLLLHSDFGLADVDGQQVSSISVTIGSVTYRTFVEDYHGDLDVDGDPLPDISGDAIIRARTLGSSGAGRASTLLFTDWQSTAAGGGNPNIDLALNGFASDGIPDPGRLGAFVLENAGMTFDDVNAIDPQTLSGGLERPLGVDPANPDQAFGAVRLGLAASGGAIPDRIPGRFGNGLTGYATGWVEVETGGGGTVGLAPFARAADGPNLAIGAPDQVLNTISGSLTFGGAQIALGGTETVGTDIVARGAFVDDLTWGMLSDQPGSQVALISAEPIARELRGQFTTINNADVPVPARDSVGSLGGGADDAYSYAQWGVFFGDLMDSDGSRQHVHLGSFAAGTPIPRNVLDTASGQASYTGHTIGNVYDGGAVRTAMGTFSENFDFDTRTGSTAMDFDNRSYAGGSTLSGETYTSAIAGGDRHGTLNGRFVGGMSGGQPNALIGAFEIQNNAAGSGGAYRAAGTFVGEK